MTLLSDKARLFFVDQGRRGGLKRSRHLLPTHRSRIAKKAAQARWEKPSPLEESFRSVRLDSPALTRPVFLEELLLEGALPEWKKLYQSIADHPFGPVAMALEKVLASTQSYGVVPLWKGILRTCRGMYS